jgi:hypothetical protein
MAQDFIPQNDADFDLFYKNYCQIVGQRTAGSPPVWSQIPVDRAIALNTGYTVWDTARKAYLADKTKALRAAKEAAKKAGGRLIRDFNNEFIRFASQVSDADKLLLGVHIPDPDPSPIPAPGTRPEFSFRLADIRKIRLDFHDQGSEVKAKPYGMDGAVVHWLVSDAPATDPAQLTQSVLATRTPFYLTFTEGDRGRILSVALQWQNKKGQKGTMSEIQSTVIP